MYAIMFYGAYVIPYVSNSGKPRFQPGAGNWHQSEPEPVEPERETEPVEREPAGTGTGTGPDSRTTGLPVRIAGLPGYRPG